VSEFFKIMKLENLILIPAIAGSILPAILGGDTLELADGGMLEGEFIGSSNKIIMFRSGSDIEAFPHKEVVAVYLSDGVNAAEAAASGAAPQALSVPAGTRLLIRMTDSVDSSRHPAGHRFRAQLESALVVDGVTVAPRNTIVYGRIVSANQAGRLAGSSEVTIEFSDLMLNDQLYPIATGGLQAKTGGEAGRTLRRTAGAAAIGGLIDGSKGARTGAKVGAGASILTRGASVNIPRGTLIETELSVAVSLPRS
jgi:hypothetical protein